nr:hypothetical protein [Streptomyces sp. NK08204]
MAVRDHRDLPSDLPRAHRRPVRAPRGATTATGTFLFAGRGLTGFTNEEERQGGLGDAAPWLVEDRLVERGAHFKAGAPWSDTVVVDGNLITGQNPQSSVTTAKEVLAALRNA